MEFHPVPSASSEVPPKVVIDYHKHPPLPNRVGQKLLSLTKEQVETFDRDGLLVIPAEQAWSKDELKLILDSVNLMDSWPDKAGHYMKYYEKPKANPNTKILCRIENFTQYNPGLEFILQGTSQKMTQWCTDLLGEQSILYKEKINYKLPGGDGFAPHQDVAAGWWMYNQTLHISTLVCIDEATAENGCLEMVTGEHMKGMLCDDWKEIPEATCDKMTWKVYPTKPGDVVFFDSYVPHKSAPNNTNKPRRVLYATYAKKSEGDLRDRYYADKRKSFPPDVEREAGKDYEYKI